MIATNDQYDAGERALKKAVLEAEEKLPFFARQLISQAPPDEIRAFLMMASRAVVDAALAVT